MGREPRRSGERFVNLSLAIFFTAIGIDIASCSYIVISDVNVFAIHDCYYLQNLPIWPVLPPFPTSHVCARLKSSGGADHFKTC